MSIEIRRLGFSYGSTDVLHDITFTAADGDIAAVLGPNGVGMAVCPVTADGKSYSVDVVTGGKTQ